jgi:TatA/E family protein of Tat protein translocase
MLSVPHMIVVFVVVLVVFGPQKLPELARGLGKLMAEFRKASTDFRSAFEEEMRDLERQAREVERKKIAPPPTVTEGQPVAPAASLEAQTEADTPGDAHTSDTPVVEPTIETVAESVPRSSEEATEAKPGDASAAIHDPTHDHQQPA